MQSSSHLASFATKHLTRCFASLVQSEEVMSSQHATLHHYHVLEVYKGQVSSGWPTLVSTTKPVLTKLDSQAYEGPQRSAQVNNTRSRSKRVRTLQKETDCHIPYVDLKQRIVIANRTTMPSFVTADKTLWTKNISKLFLVFDMS